ncbi:18238_t:CDS:2, partial [Gigaspora margarita]
ISQSNKNKVQKFMLEVSKNSSLQLNRDITSTVSNETKFQPSNTNFTFLYKNLCDAIILADRKTQEAIMCYCLFGKAFIQRRNEIASDKQVDPESNIVSRILNKEIKTQLPADTSNSLLRKRIEKAKKLYKLFDAIGMDKIYRIHSFSADSISKLTKKEIQYIIDNVSFDYSIQIELHSNEKNSEHMTQLCEPSSQSDNNLFPLKKMLSKEMRNQVINKLTTHFIDSPKLDKNNSIDTEGEHQTDSYWVLGSHCPLCRENHMSLYGKWWLDSQSKNTYYLYCTNLKEPGILLDDVLKAYSDNSKQIQELKTRRFTSPIPWNNALILPDKTTNISCLETFALNILNNSSPNKIVSNVNVTELDPCTLCNQELFLYEIKQPITLLICGHIFYRDCIESSIKISSKCPKQNCEKEIESVVDSMPGSQDLDLMVTSPALFKSPIITQKTLIDRYEYYKTNNPKHTAQALVNKEISKQLPTTISDTLLQKRKERAQKIYNLFSEIGENKIQHIKTISALSISKLSQDEIDTILVHFSQK